MGSRPGRPPDRARAGGRGARCGLAEAVAGSDLVVVAAPVAELPHAVREVLELAPGGCVVTDVGSTKSAVCAAAAGDSRFIGGHPICGAETRGPERANAELFDGATWFLTPTAGTGPELLRTVHGFVTSLGARPVAIDAGAHDRLVAVTSHLPHALANVLLNQAGATRVDGHDPLQAAGGSLRDMTRIAGANPRIWVDIFLDNRDAVVAALGEHRRRIEQLETALEAEDGGQLARWIAEAAGNRRRMLATAHGDPGTLQRLRVHLRTGPACSRASSRRSAPRGSTSRTSRWITSRPTAAAPSPSSSPVRTRRIAPPRCSRSRGTASSSRP